MHVALLFPPACDPRSPHLAIPCLAAHLRANGIRTTVRDVDLDALLWAVQPERVKAAADTCARRISRGADENWRAAARQALSVVDFVTEHIGRAPTELRDADAFLDPFRHHTARETIDRALQLVSLANGHASYGIGPIRYDVAGHDAARLVDLDRVTADPRNSIFDEFYRDDVIPELERDRPDLVGISLLNGQQIIPGLMLARLLRERGHLVVIGGTVYAKFVPELMRRPRFFELFCDAVVPYEGETALIDLIERISSGRPIGGAINTIARDHRDRLIIGDVHVEDVRRLPTPDFTGLPLDRYLCPVPVLPVLTGKGCYFNRCKFCDIPAINRIASKAYRLRPPERVADDVVELHDRYGTRFFEFTDEALAPNVLLRIGEALHRRSADQLDLRFVGYARFEPAFTTATCSRLHAMGVRKLFFGLESGSQKMLDHMDKGVTLNNARVVLEACASARIAVHMFSIVGFPEETETMARETLSFFLDNADLVDRPDTSFDIHPFSLDLRTDYFDRAGLYGVDVDQVALRRVDFPLSAERWHNANGLDRARVRELIAEFHATLHRALPTWRRFPAHLWPSFEEYALLYADAYGGRPFSFRLTLPDPGDPSPVQLTWPASLHLTPRGDLVDAWSLLGHATLPSALLALLHQPRPAAPGDDLLADLAADLVHEAAATADATADASRLVDQLRVEIDRLLGAGVLQLRGVAPDSVRAVVG